MNVFLKLMHENKKKNDMNFPPLPTELKLSDIDFGSLPCCTSFAIMNLTRLLIFDIHKSTFKNIY